MPGLDSTISMMREEDEKLQSALQFLVPVHHGGQEYHPAAYKHTKDPVAWEKQNWATMLTGRQAIPTLEITDGDIELMKEKSYKALQYDFDNYVGMLYKPNENPANKAFLKQVYPEWFDHQIQPIEEWHKTKQEMEKLIIKGAENHEEHFKLYRLGYKPGEGIGRAVNHRMGWNDALIDQLGGASPQLLDRDQAAALAPNFQRGIFNTNKREIIKNQMFGHIAGGEHQRTLFRGPADNRQLGMQPFSPFNPVQFWNDGHGGAFPVPLAPAVGAGGGGGGGGGEGGAV